MIYQHQQKIIKENKLLTGLWLGCGGGKTRIALLLARGKTLVICPKTIRDEKVWEKELEKLGLEINLLVISKEFFRKYYDSPLLSNFNTVIADEIHTLAGAIPNVRYVNKQPIPKTSQLFDALSGYLQKHNPERFYALSATPIRSPMVVWAIAKLLGESFDFYQWRQKFYIKLPMPGRDVWVPKKDDETKDTLAKIVQKLGYVGQLSDWFDMPDINYKTHYVKLTIEQKKALKEVVLDFPDPLVQCGKRHQIENGVLAGDEFNKPEAFKNEKIDKILDYSIEFPRFIIWARYTAQIEAIRLAIESTGKKVLVLQGATKNRQEVLDEARNSKECVLICQSQLSMGWELPEYDVMVFASLDYSIVNKIQSDGRILRANALGNKKLYITLVAKGGVDEAVYKSILNKKDFSERIYLNL